MFLSKGQALNTKKMSVMTLGSFGLALACLIIAIPLLNLPPTRIGFHRQMEPCLIAFWGFSAATALWLFFLGRKYPRLLQMTAQLPLVWGPLLIGFVTLVLCPFHV